MGGGTRGHTLVIILKQSPGPTPTSNDALMHVARIPSSIRGDRLEKNLIILNFISIIYSKHVRRKSRQWDRAIPQIQRSGDPGSSETEKLHPASELRCSERRRTRSDMADTAMMDTAGSEALEEEDASVVYDPFYRVRKGGPKEARLFRVALMGEFNSIKVYCAVTCTNNLCLTPLSLSPSHTLSPSLSLYHTLFVFSRIPLLLLLFHCTAGVLDQGRPEGGRRPSEQ